jgi:hypothetical protein
MDNSNEINEVVVDGQLTSVSLNSRAGEPPQNEDPPQAGEQPSQNMEHDESNLEKDVESAINTNTEANADNTAAEVIEIEESDTNAKKSSLLGNFGASHLNVCTFGLLSPNASPAVPDHTMVSTEKIVQDLAKSEQGLGTTLDLNETMESEQDSNEYMRDRALLSADSIPSDEDSTSDYIVSQLAKKRRSKKIAFYAIGIFFWVMVGLFIFGGILFSRNGW